MFTLQIVSHRTSIRVAYTDNAAPGLKGQPLGAVHGLACQKGDSVMVKYLNFAG